MADRVVAVARRREAVLGCRAAGRDGHALPSAPIDGDPAAGIETLLADLGIGSYHVERRVVVEGDVVHLVTAEDGPAAWQGPVSRPDLGAAGRAVRPGRPELAALSGRRADGRDGRGRPRAGVGRHSRRRALGAP
ncbi:MAG: hypothetical protein U5J98_05855 [Halobacteriales archaeon]|nr:hypothetical protein [Halobacteriales archaeon]